MVKHFINIPSAYRLGTGLASLIPKGLSYSIVRFFADLSYFIYGSSVSHDSENCFRGRGTGY